MAVNNKMLKAAKLFDAVSACWLKSRYNFSTASALYDRVGNWRIRHGLPATGKEYGPMRDLPDWSFADGRPAPLPVAMKKRIKLNKEYCEKIIKLTKEVDECFELNKAKADMEEKKREHAIQNRLKSKGKAFT